LGPYFAQNFASKFGQGLAVGSTSYLTNIGARPAHKYTQSCHPWPDRL